VETDGAEKGRGGWWKTCLGLIVFILCLPLGFCGWFLWQEPRTALPPEVKWSEIIGFNDQGFFREGCIFGAYKLAPETIKTFKEGEHMPGGWYRTPLAPEDREYAVDLSGESGHLYALGATSCASDKTKRLKLNAGPDRALSRAGSWYKISNHGEGLVIVSPDEGLAWFLYFG
jgi:hypothetical protein